MIFNDTLNTYTNKFKIGIECGFFFPLIIILLLSSVNVYSQPCGTTVYNNTGTYTWTIPAGVTSVTVQAWGGGGSGANGGNADGGGGGGGAYASSVVTVTPGATYTVTAGAGGVLNTNGSTRQTGVNGGSSSFGNNIVVAAGGKGGGPTPGNIYLAGTGGSAAASIGTIVNAGGNGGCGDGCNTGSGPGGAGQPGTGNSAGGGGGDESAAGGAGAGLGGNGGQGGIGSTTNCGVTNPGGGGGGSFSGPVGDHDNGGDGQVIINYVNGGCAVTLIYGGGNTMTSPNAETICSGDNVNLPLVSSVTTTFTWIAAENPNVTGEFFTSQQTTATINNTLTNTTDSIQIVTYTVTPTNSCPNGLQSQIVNITVYPSVVNITSANTATICSGSAVNLLLTANAAISFTWQAAPNANVTGESTTQQTTTDTITDTLFNTTAAVQTVTYTVTGTCVTTPQIVNVTVNPSPPIIVSSNTICTGQSTQLTATGANSYKWSGGITNGTAFVPAATSTYTVTGTNTTTGCSDTATATITVNSLPVVSSTPSATVCAGTSATLTGIGAVTYIWSGGITNNTAFFPAATGTYTVTGTDANGCADTSTTSVTIFSVTVNATANTVCAGGSVTLMGGGANTYVWSGGVINGVSFIPTTTGTYTVTGTSTTLDCANTTTTSVTVNLLPAVSYTVTPSAAVCVGTPVTLNGTGANTYIWSGGITNGTKFVPAATATYTVTGTNTTTGCSDTATATITVNLLPVVNSTLPATVCAGTSATLTGTGAVTYIWSGGVTNGIAFFPAVTGTYTVTGTDANGCSDTSTTSVTIFSVTVNATTNTVCAGENVTLNGGGASTYVWSGGVINGVSFIPATTGTYTVTGTSATLGCSNTTTTTVTVNLLPPISSTIAPSATICAGTPVTLNGAGANTYIWSGGITNGTAFTPAVTSTYTVTGTNTTTGCSDTATATVFVGFPHNVSSPDTVCAGTSITLSGTGGDVSYIWSGGITNGVAFVPAATASYTVTGTAANGCVSTDAITIVVDPLPVVNSTIAPSATVCSGTPITLSGTGAAIYLWSDSVITNGVPFVPPTSATYTVIGIDTNGCSNTNITSVTVLISPTLTVNSVGVCIGSSATLTAGGANSYSWLPATGLSSTTDSTVTANPTVTTTYTVTSINSCGSDSAFSVVTVNPSPSGSISSSGIGCQSINAVFTGAKGIPPYIFAYQLNGVTQSVASTGLSSTANLSLQNVPSGKYTCYLVSVKDSNSCSSTVSNDSTTITVYQNPIALFTVSPQQTNISTPIISINNACVGADSWTWNFGDSSTSFSPNPSPHTYNDTGTYTIKLVISDSVGCKDSTYQRVTITQFFTLYIPNTFTPNGDGKNDVFMPKGEGFSAYQLNIYDRWGNMIFNTNDINNGWDGKANGGSQVAQMDTYVYLINVTASSNEHDYIYNGTFNLVR